MDNSKVAVAVHKTISFIQMIAGIAMAFLCGVCVIMYVTDREYAAENGTAFLSFSLVVVAIGVWLIILSVKKSNLLIVK